MLKKSVLFISVILFFLIGNVFFTSSVFALDTNSMGFTYPAYSGLKDSDLRLTVVSVIKTSMSLLGMVAVGLIVYAGYLWMTAAGNEERAGKAKKILYGSTIGLIIIFASYSITLFVSRSMYRATTGTISTNLLDGVKW